MCFGGLDCISLLRISTFHIPAVTFWHGCLSGPVVLHAMAALFGSTEVITASIRAWRKLLQPPALMFDRIIRKLSVLVITGAHLFFGGGFSSEPEADGETWVFVRSVMGDGTFRGGE